MKMPKLFLSVVLIAAINFPLLQTEARGVPKSPGSAPSQQPESKATTKPPNIVMIISDDHHWGDYSFMDHPVVQTPNLDRLASQSAVFPHGYVPTSLCRPSLATMITGLYPSQHGITGNDPAAPKGLPPRGLRENATYLQLCDSVIRIMDDVPTLPRLLAQKGYVSFQSGKWWEGSFSRGGFQEGMTHGDPKRGGRHGDEGLKIGRQSLQPVFEFIDQADHRPFFLWYAPFLPHTPHNPPEDLLSIYRADKRPDAIVRYYAMCGWFDQTCGQLLDYLDHKKVADNTIVIYVADNGWIQRTPQTVAPKNWKRAFAPRSKQSPYDGGVRTPIMIRWPGKVVPGVRDQFVSSIDFAPTILAAAGSGLSADMTGKNLIQVAAADNGDKRFLFGEIFAHDIADINDPQKSLIYTWCTDGRWKLILTHQAQMGRYGSLHPQTKREAELYDLQNDPHEKLDLAAQKPDIVSALKKAINQWREKTQLVR